MIVDDEPFNIQGLIILIKKALKNLDINPDHISSYIDKSYNGLEALKNVKKAAKQGVVYSLIFMD